MRTPPIRSARSVLTIACALALLLTGPPLSSHAVTTQALADVYVSVAGSDVTGDGTLADPVRTIEMGIALVTPPGTVHVLPGTYHDGESFPLVVPAGVMIESTDGKWVTTIQGDGAHSVLRMRHPIEGTGLRGLEITGGGSGAGGGIDMIMDVVDTPDSNWPRITECDIRGNASPAGTGGGLFVVGNPGKVVSPFIEDVRIFSNSAARGGGAGAGAYATAIFQRCEFSSNSAADFGGNIYLSESGSSFYTCDIVDGSSHNGGNVEISGGGSPEFVNCSVSGGTATEDGGGLCIDKSSGDVMLRGVRIVDNHAVRAGGGVKGTSIVDPTSLTFVNCLIAENISDDLGGGVYLWAEESDEVTFESCTIAYNEGDIVDGFFMNDQSSVPVAITNCVFRHRQHTMGDETSVEDYYGFSPADDVISYSLFRNTTVAGTQVIHGDPLFIDPGASDYHVQVGSPVIDAGTVLPWPSTTDLDLEPRPLDGDSSGVAQFDMGCYERAPAVAAQLAGDTRYETACEVADRGFYSALKAVIASGEGFADALSAAGLAGQIDGPVLLVRKDSVPDAVFDTLSELAVTDITIVGGEVAVSPAVVTALEAQGYAVERVSGATRYETSAQVAREIARLQGPLFTETALVARGDDFPDALAVGPLAFARATPVLLVTPGTLPPAISDAVVDLGVEALLVAGGEAAVGPDVYDALEALGPIATIERVSGSDRYGTAVAIATEGISRGWVSAGYVGVATGLNFPDALAGGPAAGNRGGVLLLCKTDSLPPAPTAFLAAHQGEVTRADVYGGDSVVTSAVRRAIEDALDW